MKRLGLSLLLVVASMAVARPASAALITFNEAGLVAGVGPDPYFSGGPKGTLLTDQFLSLGVLFSIGADGAAYVSNDAALGMAGGETINANYLVVNSLAPNNIATPQTTMHASFVDPLTGLATTASGVSMLVTDWNVIPDPRVIVQAFGLQGNLLETINLANYSGVMNFTSTDIWRLDFIDNGGDGHIIDNFAFTLAPTTVPEPSTLAMMASGLVMFAGTRRRWWRR